MPPKSPPPFSAPPRRQPHCSGCCCCHRRHCCHRTLSRRLPASDSVFSRLLRPCYAHSSPPTPPRQRATERCYLHHRCCRPHRRSQGPLSALRPPVPFPSLQLSLCFSSMFSCERGTGAAVYGDAMLCRRRRSPTARARGRRQSRGSVLYKLRS